MKTWTEHVRAGRMLDAEDIRAVVWELLSPDRSNDEAADFLEALHRRGETPSEVASFAACFLAQAEPFPVSRDLGVLIDVCGTGGDKLGLFNVSTAVMFVAAGAGARVVKHGNRRVTSQSGGADVLEVLGVPADLGEDRLRAMLEEAGAVFLFAPRFHPSFKNLAAARQLLAARGSASVFNMLGPLLNPAQPQRQLTGVFSPHLLDIYGDVLPLLGRERAWVVHGSDGANGAMDEISTSGPTMVLELSGKSGRRRTLDPASMGVDRARVEDLRGGDAAENARILHGILSGDGMRAARDIVLVNSAAALLVAGVADDWIEAFARATESLDSGAARRTLDVMRRVAGAG